MKQGILIAALAGLVLLAGPVLAAINNIPAGGTVFIGEQTLDISAGVGADTQIAWFPSTAVTTSATPEKIIDVTSSKTNFAVESAIFSSRNGNWYAWTPGRTVGTSPVAFIVDTPTISIRLDDVTAGVEVTDKWLYTGDELQVRIQSNLDVIGQRPGVPGAGAPVTIKFETPQGAVLTAVTNKAGATTQLVDIPVTSSSYSTGAIWDSTGASGTYTIWAECNANGMNDNNGREGETSSKKTTVLVQERNPLISVNTQTTASTQATTAATTAAITKTTAPTTTITTVPATTITTGQVPATPVQTQGTTAAATTRAPGFGIGITALACLAGTGLLAWNRR
jgi:hypothetical protein